MSKPRLFVPVSRWADRVDLLRQDTRHLLDVLRMDAGDEVEVFDGQGRACLGTIVQQEGRWSLVLGPARQVEVAPGGIALAVALLKGRKMDDVIRMATEIGITSFVPFTCARSVPRLDADRAASRAKRWRGIAEQAARQSGRSWVPVVHEVMPFASLLAFPAGRPAALLHERARVLLADVWSESGELEHTLAIGPEGGFGADEVRQAEAAGFSVAGLGLPILRAETAAVVGAAFACARPLEEREQPRRG